MNEKLDISKLSKVKTPAFPVKDHKDQYSKYTLYVEQQNAGIPEEYVYNQYLMFNAGLDNLANTSITVSEHITSRTQMHLENNYTQISSEINVVNDIIEYDKINEFISNLDRTDKYSKITSKILDWISTDLGIDFHINPNPEDADNSNLILVQKCKNDIKEITESILNKVFRNLMQMIRALHSYRLYGIGSTFFTGSASDLNTAKKVAKLFGLPESSITEYSGNYIVGKSAYEEDIKNVCSGTIKNAKYNISPYSSFGIAKHSHDVSYSKTNNLSTSFSSSAEAMSTCTNGAYVKPTHDDFDKTAKSGSWATTITDQSRLEKTWREVVASAMPKNPYGSWAMLESFDKGSIITSTSWSYSWNSNDLVLSADPGWKDNIFKDYKTTLPTYSTYVWKWTGEDDTNIENPTKNF